MLTWEDVEDASSAETPFVYMRVQIDWANSYDDVRVWGAIISSKEFSWKRIDPHAIAHNMPSRDAAKAWSLEQYRQLLRAELARLDTQRTCLF